ncbi:MAG TPA: phosphoenolpyruvate synthase, partial [Alphaproteobacteria bacterium]|nr:phosphoenolpyruvate synthase [Alphaproteobacteria bacterium]
MPSNREKFIRWFEAIGLDDVPLVGGKTASLGEMYRSLTARGVKVPNGFAVTAEAYRHLLSASDLAPTMRKLLRGIDKRDVKDFSRRGAALRRLIYDAPLSDELIQDIHHAYEALEKQYGAEIDVAVRSSATAEDLPTASFAGQHDSYLNIRGKDGLVDACKRCFASLFTDRAIGYRIDNGFDHFKVALSIAVQKMVRSDEAASGVMFTLDTESGFRDVVLVNAAFGLGENVVQGAVDPDEFLVHKPTYDEGYRTVLRRRLGAKQMTMVYAKRAGRNSTRNLRTKREDRERFCITDDEVLALAGYAIEIEKHYSDHAGHTMPMDLEWAKDGESGELFIIQARPETVASRRERGKFYQYTLKGKAEVLAIGRAVGEKIAAGPVTLIADAAALSEFSDGDVLVADTTSPDWEPVMKRAAAIVTNRGGRTCHAAIVARELGIPAVVGAGDATRKLAAGEMVTVSCAEGDDGKIYDGAVPFETHEIDTGNVPRTQTKVMINLGNPDSAFHMS